MANWVCGLSRIPRVALLPNIKICRQFRTITALTGFDSASHKPKSQTKYSSHKDNAGNVSSIVLLATGLRLQYTVNRYNSSGSSNTGSTTASTIEEFRAREEQREEEFSKQQEKQETSSPQSEASEEKVNAIKTKILDASLPFVSTYGWTRQTLTHGSEAAGYPGVIHGLFPNGGAELIRYFLNKSNESLVEHMAKETNNGETQVSDIPEFLHRMVKLRLQMIEPYISHWPQALAIMSLPQNVQMALAQLLTMVDDICYYSGDRSVEFKWYARRVGLATIFKVTELFMLQDSSVDHQTTWAFLKNRIDEATQIESFMTQTENFAQKVPNGLTSAFVTARNILGLDFKRR